MTARLSRFEGRLFAEAGCLFLVVHANEASGVARVTCRVSGETEVIEMPLSEVAKRISSASTLILDNLNGPESVKRVIEGKDGWYFTAREGQMGPYRSRREAGRALVSHVLAMQTALPVRGEPPRAGGSRRREDVPAERSPVGAIS